MMCASWLYSMQTLSSTNRISEPTNAHSKCSNKWQDEQEEKDKPLLLEWLKEPEFRTLFDEQPALCLPHFGALSAAADRALKKKDRAAFGEAAKALCRRTLEGLQADVDRFCEMYDYRHRDAQTDWGTSKDAPERLVWFLTSKSL